MKLNNKGWGLNTLLIIGSCLLIFLLIAAYYIYVLYSSLNNNYYIVLEDKLVNSAKKYGLKSKLILHTSLICQYVFTRVTL